MLLGEVEALVRALLIASLLLCASSAFAEDRNPQGRNRYGDDEERTLTAQELRRYAAVYYAPIRACYLQHGRVAKGATGELALKLTVHRDGYIHELAIDAPGVKGKALRRLDACIRNEALAWHFPLRRDFTTAILPYYFMYLDIPTAGPFYGCRNPRGCQQARPPTRPPRGKRTR